MPQQGIGKENNSCHEKDLTRWEKQFSLWQGIGENIFAIGMYEETTFAMRMHYNFRNASQNYSMYDTKGRIYSKKPIKTFIPSLDSIFTGQSYTNITYKN